MYYPPPRRPQPTPTPTLQYWRGPVTPVPLTDGPVPFDADEIEAIMHWLAYGQRSWRSLAAQRRLPFCAVRYEDLVEDRQATLARVPEFLGAPVPDTTAGPTFIRQSSDVNEDFVRRHHAHRA